MVKIRIGYKDKSVFGVGDKTFEGDIKARIDDGVLVIYKTHDPGQHIAFINEWVYMEVVEE